MRSIRPVSVTRGLSDRAMAGRADPSSATRAFTAFATRGWRLSRLDNGLRIFEQDVYGGDDEEGSPPEGRFSVDGVDDDDARTPVTTNASDIKSPGCKVRGESVYPPPPHPPHTIGFPAGDTATLT